MTTPIETAADDIDSLLLDALSEDLLTLLLAPPRVPLFAALTVAPAKAVQS